MRLVSQRVKDRERTEQRVVNGGIDAKSLWMTKHAWRSWSPPQGCIHVLVSATFCSPQVYITELYRDISFCIAWYIKILILWICLYV
jgi:hypothetical protein